jgi:hypothetical protein
VTYKIVFHNGSSVEVDAASVKYEAGSPGAFVLHSRLAPQQVGVAAFPADSVARIVPVEADTTFSEPARAVPRVG